MDLNKINKSQLSSLNEKEIEEVLAILGTATKRVRPTKPKNFLESVAGRIATGSMFCAAGSMVVLIGVAAISAWTGNAWFDMTAQWLGLAIVVSVLSAFVSTVLVDAPTAYQYLLRPFDTVLERTNEAAVAEAIYVSALAKRDIHILEYTLVHYKEERTAFERRGSLLSGPLVKIGIFPALLAYSVAVTSLPANAHPLVSTLVWLVPAFYALAFFCGMLHQKMDRVIALLEFTISMRREKSFWQ